MTAPDIITILRDQGLTTTVTIEPYIGQGGSGPVYGAPVTVEAYVEWKRRKVRTSLGEEVIANGAAYARLATSAPEKSRVTSAGRVAYVLGRNELSGGGMETPDHVEIVLT